MTTIQVSDNNMKRVSFNVAKAIKKAGYSQYSGHPIYDKDGKLRLLHQADIDFGREIYSAPTYLEVWLWLWREKGNQIQIDYAFCGIDEKINDPEEAIIVAIDYFVNENLLK